MAALHGLKQFIAQIQHWQKERHCRRQEMIKELIREQMDCCGKDGDSTGADGNGRSGENRYFQQHKQQFLRKFQEFHRCHRQLQRSRPFVLLFYLFIWFILFHYMGGKAIVGVFAVLIGAKGFFEFFFLRRLEKRIFEPIDRLKQGVEEIAKGNYDVNVECDVFNDLTLLVDSFNHMARQLRESEKLKAEYEANRKGLIANISHDLKTPMTSIQGYVEAILECPEQSGRERQKYLQIIYNNSLYMNKLIDDLFLFAKLDMDKLEFRFEQISIRDFMADLMEEFRLELEDQDIKFNYFDRLEGDYMVKIDRKRIHQVVKNVIGNAVKYGTKKGLIIEAVLEQAAPPQCGVLIGLSDNGPGIPEDKLPYVFDRFYRIDAERNKDGQSTGLGLAIARELVEAHGGWITIANNATGGSCFTIGLPVLA